MIELYHYITSLMIIALMFSWFKYSCLSALSALVLLNFATYCLTQFTVYVNSESAVIESLRISAIMIICMVLGLKSIKPFYYLCYSLLLFGFIVVNGLFLINPAFAPHELYLILTVAELLFFAKGVSAVHKAKTKYDILNSNANFFRCICRNRASSCNDTTKESSL